MRTGPFKVHVSIRYLECGNREEVGAEEVPQAVGQEHGPQLPLLGVDGAHQPDGQARLQHGYRRGRHLHVG